MLLLAAVHALPVLGVLGGATLREGYGLTSLAPSTELLLRHRAVLFGLLAAGALWSLRRHSLRMPMLAALAIADASFLYFAVRAEQLNSALHNVALADLGALLLAAVAALALRHQDLAGPGLAAAQKRGAGPA